MALAGRIVTIEDAEQDRKVAVGEAAKRDKALVLARKEVRQAAMSRMFQRHNENNSARRLEQVEVVDMDRMENEENPEAVTPAGSDEGGSVGRSARKRKDTTNRWGDIAEIIEIKGLRAEQDSSRLKLDADRLKFKKSQASKPDDREEKRVKLQQEQICDERGYRESAMNS
jgi:hypothetical protein